MPRTANPNPTLRLVSAARSPGESQSRRWMRFDNHFRNLKSPLRSKSEICFCLVSASSKVKSPERTSSA